MDPLTGCSSNNDEMMTHPRRSKSWHKFVNIPSSIRTKMKRGGGGGDNSDSQQQEEHLQGDDQGDGGDDKFVYRVVGDHSPLWTTLTQAQSITDYES